MRYVCRRLSWIKLKCVVQVCFSLPNFRQSWTDGVEVGFALSIALTAYINPSILLMRRLSGRTIRTSMWWVWPQHIPSVICL